MGLADLMGRDEMGRDEMGRDGMGTYEIGRDEMGRYQMGTHKMGRDEMGRDDCMRCCLLLLAADCLLRMQGSTEDLGYDGLLWHVRRQRHYFNATRPG